MLESLISFTEVTIKDVTPFSYLLIFSGGVLTSLTPCVYPLIPVTIGYIGANSAGKRQKAFFISLSYVLGIACVYSFLGAAAALTGSIFGEISSNPWTYLIVGNIFLILGLSMIGLFTIPVPGFLSSSSNRAGTRGVLGAFFVGISAGFVIGPCTAPILGAVLTYVGSRQNLFLGISFLFTYALGIGFILLLVATFTGLAASLPKSGRWLNIIKNASGIILIACAEYFIIKAGMGF